MYKIVAQNNLFTSTRPRRKLHLQYFVQARIPTPQSRLSLQTDQNRQNIKQQVFYSESQLLADAFDFVESPLWPVSLETIVILLIKSALVVIWTRKIQELKQLKASSVGQQGSASNIVNSLLGPLEYFVPILLILSMMDTVILQVDVAKDYVESYSTVFPVILERILQDVCQFLHYAREKLADVTQCSFVIVCAWFLNNFKRSVISAVIEQSRQQNNGDGDTDSPGLFSMEHGEARQVLAPLNTVTTWIIYGVSALICMNIVGIDVRPLVGVLGGSSLIVGFASQQILVNMFAGINLILFRPIVIGDRIRLYGGGGNQVLTGTIERITALRTVIRADDQLPVALPNKALIDYMIVNESRASSGRTDSAFMVRRFNVLQEYSYDKIDSVIQFITLMRVGVSKVACADLSVPWRIAITQLKNGKVEVTIQVASTARTNSHYENFQRDMIKLVLKSQKDAGLA